MNAERLLALYEQVAEAPGAIARLRRFVLDLAVRGKLVVQDAGDEPAASALRRIKAKPYTDGAFALPTSWTWVDVDAVSQSRLGKMLDKAKNKGSPRPYLRNINVRWFGFDLSDLLEMPFEDAELKEFSLKCGDVLICEGGEPGRAAVWDERVEGIYFQKAIHRVRFEKLVDPHFFLLCLKASAEDGRLAESFTGTGIKHFTGKGLRSYQFPLPPLAEQRRIVAKVEELMTLLDRLEAARTARETARDRLTAASLARLTAPEADPAEFPNHARFALVTLPTLTARPDQIKVLRQAILNLAVRGKLVEQDPADEALPKVDKGLPSDTAAPFDIPHQWQWSRLRALGTLKGGGTPSKARDDFWTGHIPWVSPKDMKVDYIEGAQFSITDAAVAGSAVNLIAPESVLFVVRGMILAHSFPVAISKVPVTINQDMKAIFLKNPEMAEYILRALKGLTPEMLARVQRSSHGTCRIEGSDYGDFLIPIPPLAEQHRIVGQVDALMALCDRLEAALTTADTTRAGLLEALLHDALVPAARTMAAAE